MAWDVGGYINDGSVSAGTISLGQGLRGAMLLKSSKLELERHKSSSSSNCLILMMREIKHTEWKGFSRATQISGYLLELVLVLK